LSISRSPSKPFELLAGHALRADRHQRDRARRGAVDARVDEHPEQHREADREQLLPRVRDDQREHATGPALVGSHDEALLFLLP
jgi:hypothetical protein